MFNPLAVIVAPRAFLRAFAALENLKLDARLSSVACVSLELSIAHTRALGVTDIVRGVSTPVPVARVARARPCAADRARAGHSIHNRHRRKRRATAEQRAMTRAASLAPATRACGRGRARATVGRPVRSRAPRARVRDVARNAVEAKEPVETSTEPAMTRDDGGRGRDGRDASTSTASFVDEAFAAIGKSVCAMALVASAFAARDAASAEKFGGSVGAPTGQCGTMSTERLEAARSVMMCNQDNWETGCLANYDDEAFDYVDGPGLTKIHGKRNMERYLRNQFDFSRQYLTVDEEVCQADSYVATWRLDMLLGTGPLRNISGISVLKFNANPESRKIVYHRDYLPDGPIWENAPIVGPLVKLQRQTYTSCMQTDFGCAKVLGGVENENDVGGVEAK